jgi:hypothetical protein
LLVGGSSWIIFSHNTASKSASYMIHITMQGKRSGLQTISATEETDRRGAAEQLFWSVIVYSITLYLSRVWGSRRQLPWSCLAHQQRSWRSISHSPDLWWSRTLRLLERRASYSYGGWPQPQKCELKRSVDHCDGKALSWLCRQTLLLDPRAGLTHRRPQKLVCNPRYPTHRGNQRPSNPGASNCVFSNQPTNQSYDWGRRFARSPSRRPLVCLNIPAFDRISGLINKLFIL